MISLILTREADLELVARLLLGLTGDTPLDQRRMTMSELARIDAIIADTAWTMATSLQTSAGSRSVAGHRPQGQETPVQLGAASRKTLREQENR